MDEMGKCGVFAETARVYGDGTPEKLRPVPPRSGPDLHRDKLGLADDADRQALRELRIVVPVVFAFAIVAWIAGAGPWMFLPALMLVFAFVQWRAAFLRRKARRDYRSANNR